MNVISILIGVIALVFALIGFFPLLGWLNWLVIPLAFVGLLIGQFDVRRGGRNLNGFIIVFSAVRLALGGGLI